MKIVALSTLTGRGAVQQATGVEPITFPPHTVTDFQPAWLDGANVIYVHLHGIEQEPYWYGDGLQTAISAEQIEACHLTGAVAFVANCFGQDSRMVAALLKAGARAVVAGPGTNYTVVGKVRGADLLGKHFIEALKAGQGAAQAFNSARSKLRLRAIFSPIERDTLQFTLHQGA